MPTNPPSPATPSRRWAHAELRVFLFGILILCGLGVLAARLWWVQVARGEEFAKRIAGRSEVKVRIPAVRGEIRDRNGLTLVQNRASYDVQFYLPDMVRGFRKLNEGQVPKVQYQASVRGMQKKMEEPDIVEIVNTAVIPRLEQLQLARDYNASQLQRHFRTNTEVPFRYLEDVDFPMLAKFSEHNVGLPGLDISPRPVREYRYGALAAHLLGYVGMPNEVREQPDIRDFHFYEPDLEGKSNVEQAMDKYLRGKAGVRVMQRDVKGMIETELRTEPPKPGNNVYLTIDARIQFIAERALRAVGRGAAVVVDPNNGDIMAMASVPSFDPNAFIPSISAKDWKTLNDDETDPLTNRATSAYAPGSTYKIVTALAGLRSGLKAGARFTCTGGVNYGNKYMKCWVLQKHMAPHGSLSLADAIKCSCNAFFYQYGNAAGIGEIDAVGEALFLGKRTGIELSGESGGILPGPDWLKSVSPRERWSNGHTANVSIGQGYVLATPLQMAMVAATVANGGTSYQPRLVDKVLDPDGKPVLSEEGQPAAAKPQVRADLRQAGVTQEQIEMVRRGMWKVVHEKGGTASRARIPGAEISGKTGTAQFWRGGETDNHTWFIAFAPYEKPKYAICVFVQGAKAGGAVSAPIAAKILDETFALERGYQPTLAALTPAKGSFQFVEQVTFESAAPPVTATAEESAEHTATVDKKIAADAQPKKARTARPDIRPEGDARGRVSAAMRRSDSGRLRTQPPPAERRGLFDRIFGRR